jgi:hypothetical protein
MLARRCRSRETAIRFLKGIAIIPPSEQISCLASKYQKLLAIPDKSIIDCFHLAVCVISEMDYLISWNYTHLSINTFIKIQKYNEGNGLLAPIWNFILTEAILTKRRQQKAAIGEGAVKS